MENNIEIKKAGINDVVLLSILASTTFYEAYFEQDESHNLAGYISESFVIQKLRDEISDPRSTFLILYKNEKAVGYAHLIDDSRLDCLPTERLIELKRFYVLERVWRIGIGRMLFEYCISEAARRDFEILWLCVWEENLRAQSFYRKFDFEQVGKVTFKYGDVDGTNLVLQKELKPV